MVRKVFPHKLSFIIEHERNKRGERGLGYIENAIGTAAKSSLINYKHVIPHND